jgi:hypothetical protein
MSQTFKINDKLTIVCRAENTRYGFRHIAELLDEYCRATSITAKVCYYNRTWEAWRFQTVICKLVEKIPESTLSKEEKAFYLAKIHDR